ncbi:MAG: hypothetical protein ACLQVY_12170 [Limisphaerales bacterium]
METRQRFRGPRWRATAESSPSRWPIRRQLNPRLQKGQLAQNLPSWLNQMPEVQAIPNQIEPN